MTRQLIVGTAVLALVSPSSAGAFTQVFNAPPDSLEPLRVSGGDFEVPASTQVNVFENGLSGNFAFDIFGEVNYAQPDTVFTSSVFNVLDGGRLDSSDGLLDFVNIFEGGEVNHSDGFAVTITMEGGQLSYDGGSTALLLQDSGSTIQRGGMVTNLTFGDRTRDPGQSRPEYTIEGGELLFNTLVADGVLNIRGGVTEFGFPSNHTLSFTEDAELSFFGSAFALDGVPLMGFLADGSLQIPQRNVTLSGVLEDGNPFSFFLSSDFQPSGIQIVPEALVTVTLVIPEPTAASLVVLASAAAWGSRRSRRRVQ